VMAAPRSRSGAMDHRERVDRDGATQVECPGVNSVRVGGRRTLPRRRDGCLHGIATVQQWRICFKITASGSFSGIEVEVMLPPMKWGSIGEVTEPGWGNFSAFDSRRPEGRAAAPLSHCRELQQASEKYGPTIILRPASTTTSKWPVSHLITGRCRPQMS
jgi:hypothetical protein